MKKLVTTIVIGVVFLVLPLSVSASSDFPIYDSTNSSEFSSSSISTFATEYKMYYRKVNEKLQYRVWNCTYGFWETEWTYV